MLKTTLLSSNNPTMNSIHNSGITALTSVILGITVLTLVILGITVN